MRIPTLASPRSRLLTAVATAAILAAAGGALADSQATQAAPAATACTSGTTVSTSTGPVCGLVQSGVRDYLGIPYAAAPAGKLRWAPPQPHPAWTTVFRAIRQGAACPQPALAGEDPPEPQSENCLNLNIQVPATATAGSKLPVLVDVHFGGFLIASPLDGSLLASQGNVIVVSINYRLGVLGFLADKALGAHSGDYGLDDEFAALRWVKQNIAPFGGDPSSVTLEGSSAGGASVCDAIASPEAKGLFQRGISESGFYNFNDNTIWWPGDCKSRLLTEAQADKLGAKLAARVGCASAANVAACLRAVPVRTLVDDGGSLFTPLAAGSIGPIVNGTTLPRSPARAFATGQVNHVSLIMGVARDEINGSIYESPVLATTVAQYKSLLKEQFGAQTAKVMARYPLSRYPDSSPFIAYRSVMADAFSVCPSLAADRALSRHIPVYSYLFDDADALSPNGGYPLGSPHSGQVIYLFPGYFEPPAVVYDADQAPFRDQLIAEWAGFARTGSPTVAGTPQWSRFRDTRGPGGRLVMDLAPAGDSALTPSSTLALQHNCGFWERLHHPRRQAART